MRPEPRVYPPAVLPSVPPVRLGRRVEAKGARPASLVTAVAVRDFGNEALLYLTPGVNDSEAPVVKRRTAALRWLWVEYHLPRLCRSHAAGWMG